MSTQKRTPAGVTEGGQYATTARTEPDVSLFALPAREHIELLIAAGRLAPGARGMDPREAIEQMAEVEGADYTDTTAELALAGLQRRGRAEHLVPGDRVLLEGRLVGVEHVERSSFAVALLLDDGATLSLSYVDDVDFEPGAGRCSACGNELEVAGRHGRWLCGPCADDAAADDA